MRLNEQKSPNNNFKLLSTFTGKREFAANGTMLKLLVVWSVFCVLISVFAFCILLYCFFFLPPLVDADEIRRLGKRFRKLDLDNSGALSLDEFLSLPELQQNPLVQRVIDIFDEDGNGEVDFKGIMITSRWS